MYLQLQNREKTGGIFCKSYKPESNIHDAYKAAERIRQNIEESLDVTISAGIALYKKGSSINDLIKNADEALYKAKEYGRNRVVCS